LLAAIRALALHAVAPLADQVLYAGAELFVNASVLLAVVALIAVSLEDWRRARPRRRLLRAGRTTISRTAGVYAITGVVNVALLWTYERFLQRVVSSTMLDPLHFSLHPLAFERLSMQSGLVLLHAAVIWSAALLIRAAGVAWWRIPRTAG